MDLLFYKNGATYGALMRHKWRTVPKSGATKSGEASSPLTWTYLTKKAGVKRQQDAENSDLEDKKESFDSDQAVKDDSSMSGSEK